MTLNVPDLYTVMFSRTFSAAHRLPSHRGKCRRIHGHNYKATIDVTADEKSEIGFVVEWETVKAIIDSLDHKLILHVMDPLEEVLYDNGMVLGLLPGESFSDWVHRVEREPTTEYLADYLAERVGFATRAENTQAGYISVHVTLSETDSITAVGKYYYDRDSEDNSTVDGFSDSNDMGLLRGTRVRNLPT